MGPTRRPMRSAGLQVTQGSTHRAADSDGSIDPEVDLRQPW
jgi:hypothetical protein